MNNQYLSRVADSLLVDALARAGIVLPGAVPRQAWRTEETTASMAFLAEQRQRHRPVTHLNSP